MNRSDPQIESAAQIIYAVVQQHSHEGARYPWQDGGNSLVQDLCRDAARKILTTPTTAGEPMAWIGHAPEPYGDMVTLDAERAARWPKYGVNVTPLYAHTAPAPDQQSVETCEVCEGKGYVTAFQNARLSAHPCPRGCTEPLAAAPGETGVGT